MPQTKERQRWLYQNDPEYRERIKANSRRTRMRNYEKTLERERKWRRDNKEKQLAGVLRWHRANKDRVNEIRRAWEKRNPSAIKLKNARRSAAIRGAAGKFTLDDIANIRKSQKGKCAYCRGPLTPKIEEIDHIIPIALGGSNYKENIQLLCRQCNRVKGKRDPIIHARSLGNLL